MRAYIAGPLFNEGERWFDEQLEACAVRAGLKTYLPHRDTQEAVVAGRTPEAIFKLDCEAIDEASIVIANLNGFAVDDGTAWELGYAYARGKHLVGVHTDMRVFGIFEDQSVNLMIECALNKLVRSLDDLETYLRAYVAASVEHQP